MGNQNSGEDSASYTETDFDDSDLYSLVAQSSRAPSPMEPPEADLSHLTEEERSQITGVLQRARELQDREEQRVRELEQEYSSFAHNIVRRASLTGMEKDVCPICLTTELVYGAPAAEEERGGDDDVDRGIVCEDCERRVCRKCGSTAVSIATKKAKWLCHMCQKRRHLYTSSGMWYHGTRPGLSRGSSVEEAMSAMSAAERRSSTPMSEDSYAGAAGEERERKQLEHSESSEERPESESRSRGVGQSSSDEDGCKSSNAKDMSRRSRTQATAQEMSDQSDFQHDEQCSLDNISPSSTYDSGLGASTMMPSADDVVGVDEQSHQPQRKERTRTMSLQRQDTTESLDDEEMQRQLLDLAGNGSLDEDEMMRQLLEMAAMASVDQDESEAAQTVASEEISQSDDVPVGDRDGAYGEESPMCPIPAKPAAETVAAQVDEPTDATSDISMTADTVTASDSSIAEEDETEQTESESANYTQYILTDRERNAVSISSMIPQFAYKSASFDDDSLRKEPSKIGRGEDYKEHIEKRLLVKSGSLDSKTRDAVLSDSPVLRKPIRRFEPRWKHESLSDSEIRSSSRQIEIDTSTLARSKSLLAKSDSTLASKGRTDTAVLGTSVSVESGIGSMDSGLNGKNGKSSTSPMNNAQDVQEGPEIRYQSFHDLRKVGTEEPTTTSMQPAPALQYTRHKPLNLPKRRRAKPVMEIPLSPIWDVEIVTPESDHPAGDFQSPEYSNPELAEESPIEPMAKVNYHEGEELCVTLTKLSVKPEEPVVAPTTVDVSDETPPTQEKETVESEQSKATVKEPEPEEKTEVHSTFGLQKRALDSVPEEPAEFLKTQEAEKEVIEDTLPESEAKPKPSKLPALAGKSELSSVGATKTVTAQIRRTEKEYKSYIETFKQTTSKDGSAGKAEIDPKGPSEPCTDSLQHVAETDKEETLLGATTVKGDIEITVKETQLSEQIQGNLSEPDTIKKDITDQTADTLRDSDGKSLYNTMQTLGTIATVVKEREGAIFVVSKYEGGDDGEAKDKEKDPQKKDTPDTSKPTKNDSKLPTRRRHKPVPLPRTSKLPTLASLDEKLPVSKIENDEPSLRDRRTRRTLPSTVTASKSTESMPTTTRAGDVHTKTTSYGKYRSRSLDAIPQSKLPSRLGKIPEMSRMKSEEAVSQSSSSRLPTKIPRGKPKPSPSTSRQASTDSNGGSPDSILESPVTPEMATKTFSEPKPSSPTQDTSGHEPAFTLASPPSPREESHFGITKGPLEKSDKKRASPPQTKPDIKAGHERGRVPLRKQKESIASEGSVDKPGKPAKPPVAPRKTIGTAMGRSFDGKLIPRPKTATTETGTETEIDMPPKPRQVKTISTAMGTSFDERRFMGRYSPRATAEATTETYGQLSEAMRQKKAMLSEAVGTSFDQEIETSKKQTTETGTSPPTPTRKSYKSTATGSFDMGVAEAKKMTDSGTSPESPVKKTVQTIATETSFEEETPKTKPVVEEKGTSPPSSPKITKSDLEQVPPSRTAEAVLGITTASTSYRENQLIFVSASQQRKSTDRRNHADAPRTLQPKTVSIGTNTEDSILRRSSIDQLLDDMDHRPSFSMSTYSDDEYSVPSVARARRFSFEDNDRRSSSLPSTPSRIPRSPSSRSTSSDTEGVDSDADTPRKIRRRLPEIPPDAVPAPMPRRSKSSKLEKGISEQEAERASELNKVKEMLYKKAEELQRQRSESEKSAAASDTPGQRQEVTRITVRHSKLPTVTKKNGGKSGASSVGAVSKPPSAGLGNGAKSANGARAKQAFPTTSTPKRLSPPQEKPVAASKQPTATRERFGYKRTSPPSGKQKQVKGEGESNLTQLVYLTKSEEDIIREIERQISDTAGTEYRAFEPAEIKREVRRKYADYIGHDYDLTSLSKLNTASSSAEPKGSPAAADRPKRESPTQRGASSKQTEAGGKKRTSPTKEEKAAKQTETVDHKRDSPTKDDRPSRSRLPVKKFTPTTKSDTARKYGVDQTRKLDDKTSPQVPRYQYIGKPDRDNSAKPQSSEKPNGVRAKKDDDKDRLQEGRDDAPSQSRSPKSQARTSPQSSPQRRRHRRQNSDPHVQKFSPIKEDSDFESQISAVESPKAKKADKQSQGGRKSPSGKDAAPPKHTRRRKDTPTIMPMSEEIMAQAERMSQEGEMIERKIKEEKREQLRKEIEKRKKQMEESARKLEEIKAMRQFDSQLDTVKTSYSYDDKLRNLDTARLSDHDRQYGSLETMAMVRNMPNFSLSQSSSFNSSSDDMYGSDGQHLIFPLKSPQRTKGEDEGTGFPQKKPAERQIHYDEVTGSAVHIVQQSLVASKDGQQQPALGLRRSSAFTGRDEIDSGMGVTEAGSEISEKQESGRRHADSSRKPPKGDEHKRTPSSPSKAALGKSKALSAPAFRSTSGYGQKSAFKTEKSEFSSAEFGSFDFRSVGRDTDWSDPHGDSDDDTYHAKSAVSSYRGHKSHMDRDKGVMSPMSTSGGHHGQPTKTFLFSRDPKDRSVRGNGLGLKIVGGKRIPGTNQIGAYIAAIYPGSVCEQIDDLKEGDQVCEWNGVTLTGRTYEEVQQVIRSTDGEVELKVRCGVGMCESPRKPPPTKQPSESYQSSMENIPEHDEEIEELEKQRYSPNTGIDPTQLSRRLEGISRAQSQSGSSAGSSMKQGSPPKWPESPTMSSPSAPSTPKGSRKQQQQQHHREKRHHRVSGEIQLQMRYEPRTHDLQINIIRARGLAPKDFNGLADPFVKVYLLPGRSAENKRRTKYIARSLNPQWEQVVFYRNISATDLQRKSIEFTVWDYDRFSPNDFMGEVLLDLSESQYLDNRPRWFQLHEHDENNSAQLPKPKTLSPIRQRSPAKVQGLVLQKCRSHQDVMDDQLKERRGSRSAEKARSLTQLSRTESDDSAKDAPYGVASLRPQRPHMPPSFWKEDHSARPTANIMRKESHTDIDRPTNATTTTTCSSATAGKRIAAKESVHSATFPPTTSTSAVIHPPPAAAARKAYSADEPRDAAHAALAAAEEVVRQLQPALSEGSTRSYTDSPLQQRKSYIGDDVAAAGGYTVSSIPIPMRRTLSAGDTTPSLEHLARNSRIKRKPHYGSSDTTDSSNMSTPRSSRQSSRERGQPRSSPVRSVKKETADNTTSARSSYYYTADSRPASTNYGKADSYHMPPLQPIPTTQSYYGYDPSISITTDTTYLSQSQGSRKTPSHRRSHHRSSHERPKSSSMGAEQFPITEKTVEGSVRSLPSDTSRYSPRKTVSIEDSRYGSHEIQATDKSETPWIVRQPPDGHELNMHQKAAMYTRMLLADLGPGQVIDPEMPRQCKATFLKKANAEMTGEIKLVLRKEVKLDGDILYVEIVQARKITYKFKVTDHLPDLYVKAYLVVGNKRVAKKKTRICKHDLEPTFNEIFQYNTSIKGLALQIMLWADGGRFGRNILVGEALIWLDTVNFCLGPVDGWYKLFLSPHSSSKGTVRTP